jgi:hypothetical protein
MKKEFLTGLTAMALAIGLVLAGCESPTNGSNGGSGANALPAQTATTLEGIRKFQAEGVYSIYFAGELTVSEGTEDLHLMSLTLTSADDLNSRAVALGGGKITVTGGTLKLAGLRVKATSGGYAVTGGTSDIAANVTVEKGATFTVADTGVLAGAASYEFADVADFTPAVLAALVAAETTSLTLEGSVINPSQGGGFESEVDGNLDWSGKKTIIYTGSAPLTTTQVGATLSDGKTLIMTNAAANLTVGAAETLTIGTSTGGSLQVAGSVIVGNITANSGKNVVSLNKATLAVSGSATIVLTGATPGVALTANSGVANDSIKVEEDSTVGEGIALKAGTVIKGKTSGDVITLTGGAKEAANISIGTSNGLVLSGGNIELDNGTGTAITTVRPAYYANGGGAAAAFNAAGTIVINTTLTTTDVADTGAAAITTTAAKLGAAGNWDNFRSTDIALTDATWEVADTFDITAYTGTITAAAVAVKTTTGVLTIGANGKLKAGTVTVGDTSNQNIVLNGATLDGGTDAGAIVLTGATPSILLDNNTASPVISVSADSTIGQGLVLHTTGVNPLTIAATAGNGKDVTLTGGIAASAKIGLARSLSDFAIFCEFYMLIDCFLIKFSTKFCQKTYY